MESSAARGVNWMGLPVIATVARPLCRGPTLQNEYLRLGNMALRSRIEGRLRLRDGKRRALTEAALALGHSPIEKVVSIVEPDTILARRRRLGSGVGCSAIAGIRPAPACAGGDRPGRVLPATSWTRAHGCLRTDAASGITGGTGRPDPGPECGDRNACGVSTDEAPGPVVVG